jgi:hypothetical protein
VKKLTGREAADVAKYFGLQAVRMGGAAWLAVTGMGTLVGAIEGIHAAHMWWEFVDPEKPQALR